MRFHDEIEIPRSSFAEKKTSPSLLAMKSRPINRNTLRINLLDHELIISQAHFLIAVNFPSPLEIANTRRKASSVTHAITRV